MLKFEDLLVMRQNKLRTLTQNCLKEINQVKVKSIVLYEKEFQENLDSVKCRYEQMFLPESEQSVYLNKFETQTEFTTHL